MKKLQFIIIGLIVLFLSCWDSPTTSDEVEKDSFIAINAVKDSLGNLFSNNFDTSHCAGDSIITYAMSEDFLNFDSIGVFYLDIDQSIKERICIPCTSSIDTVQKIGQLSLHFPGNIPLYYFHISEDTQTTYDTILFVVRGVAPLLSINNSSDTIFSIKELDTLKLEFSVSGAYQSSTPYFLPASNLPTGAQFDTTSGIFTYIPDTSVAQKDSVKSFSNLKITASDNCTPAVNGSFQFYINVLDSTIQEIIDTSNNKPIFEFEKPATSYQISEGQLLLIPFFATDLDNDKISYFISETTIPGTINFDTSSETITWQTGPNDMGLYTIKLAAYDLKDTTTVTIDIAIGNVNLPPKIFIDSVSQNETLYVKENENLSFKVLVTDPNSEDTPILLLPTNLPSQSSFDTITHIFSYTPNLAVSSKDSNKTFSNITFIATDNVDVNGFDTFSINISVIDSNSAPVAFDDFGSIGEDDSLFITPLDNDIDSDGDSLYIKSVSNGLLGSAQIIENSILYTPEKDEFGKDTLTYEVSEINGKTSTAKVFITIEAVNDAPHFTGGGDCSVLEDDGIITINNWAKEINSGAVNESDQTLTFYITVDSDTGSILKNTPHLSSNGVLTFETESEKNGVADLSVQLIDNGDTINGGKSSSSIYNFSITISEVNDAPTFILPDTNFSVVEVNENSSEILLFQIHDVDGASPNLAISNPEQWTTITDEGSGNYTLTITPGYLVASASNPITMKNLIIKAVDQDDTSNYSVHTVKILVNNTVVPPPVFTIKPTNAIVGIGNSYEAEIKATNANNMMSSLSFSLPQGLKYDSIQGKVIGIIERSSHKVADTSFTIEAIATDTFNQSTPYSWDITFKAHEWNFITETLESTQYYHAVDSNRLFKLGGTSWLHSSSDAGLTWDTPLILNGVAGIRDGVIIKNNKIHLTCHDMNDVNATAFYYQIDITSNTFFNKLLNGSHIDIDIARNGTSNTAPYIGIYNIPTDQSIIYDTQVQDSLFEFPTAYGKIFDVEVTPDGNTIFIVTEEGIYRKAYNENTWLNVNSSMSYQYRDFFLECGSDDGSILYLKKEQYTTGQISLYKSTNALTATNVNFSGVAGFAYKIKQILMLSEDMGWIVDVDGNVWFSNDGFLTFSSEIFLDASKVPIKISNIFLAEDGNTLFAQDDSNLFRY